MVKHLTKQNLIYTLRFSSELARRLFLRINKNDGAAIPLVEYKRLKKLLDYYERACYMLNYNLAHRVVK